MTIDFDAHLRADSAAFRAAVLAAAPDDVVPTCPGWTADDLLWHLGEVQRFWADVVGDRLGSVDGRPEPTRPDRRDALVEFFDRAHADLAAALVSTADDVPCWTWHEADQTVGFVRRRQAHEALVHRLDAELAAGTVNPVDPDLAADGIDELLGVYWSGLPPWAEPASEDTFGIVEATDLGRRWPIRIVRWSGTSPNTGRSYTEEPTLLTAEPNAEATFRITGSADDLHRWMWSRQPDHPVDLVGDTEAIEQLVAEGLD